MRTTLDLQDQLLIRAKKLAAESHRTLTAVIEDALRLALESPDKKKSLKPFKVRTFDGGGFAPGLDLDKAWETVEKLEGLQKEDGSFRY